MTSPEHKSGTDRCAEVAVGLEEDIIINVQGDEPFIEVQALKDLINIFYEDSTVQIATLASLLEDEKLILDRNTVKLVKTLSNKALYFSRSAIPSSFPSTHHKHIGVYAFKREILLQLAELPISKLEQAESLEQLRWLENDFTINTVMTNMESLSIDTEEDLKSAELLIKSRTTELKSR